MDSFFQSYAKSLQISVVSVVRNSNSNSKYQVLSHIRVQSSTEFLINDFSFHAVVMSDDDFANITCIFMAGLVSY